MRKEGWTEMETSWLKKKFDDAPDKNEFVNTLKEFIHDHSPLAHNPVDLVRWVPINKIQANDYNPNQVATNEMQLLYKSIEHDGYTQPIVTIYDKKIGKYVVVDGFHRYNVMRTYKDIHKKNRGLLPVVVINKDINDRMASTIRHNRARGRHSIDGMSNIVFEMLDNGWTDADIISELGMEYEELIRLKHITGFSKLFENVEYSKAWKARRQLQIEREFVKNGGTGGYKEYVNEQKGK